MKKLLGIVVLGLLLSGNAFAELITLKNCYFEKYVWVENSSHTTTIENGIVKRTAKPSSRTTTYKFKSFDEMYSHIEFDGWENTLFTLDTVTETITLTRVNSESYIQRMLENDVVAEKFSKLIYKITDLGGNVATAINPTLQKNYLEDKIDVDFVSNKVYIIIRYFFKSSGGIETESDTSGIYKCVRQK